MPVSFAGDGSTRNVRNNGAANSRAEDLQAEQRRKVAARMEEERRAQQAAQRQAQQEALVRQRQNNERQAADRAKVQQRQAAAAPAAAPTFNAGGNMGMTATASYGGGGSGFSSDLGGGGIVSPDVSTAPVIPDVNADSTYQAQLAELAKAWADYDAQNNMTLGQYDTNYNGGLRKLGWSGQGFDRNDMQGLYGRALADNQNDFAARGLLRSGAFAEADSQLNNDFAERKTDMDTARTQFRDTQNQQLTNYRGQNDLAKQAAQREAIARIAAQYGVSLDQVPIGKA